MVSLKASAEIPWLSRDLRTSSTSIVPVSDIGAESLLGFQEESAVCFSVWEEDWVVGQHLDQNRPPCLNWPFLNNNDPLNFFPLNLL